MFVAAFSGLSSPPFNQRCDQRVILTYRRVSLLVKQVSQPGFSHKPQTGQKCIHASVFLTYRPRFFFSKSCEQPVRVLALITLTPPPRSSYNGSY